MSLSLPANLRADLSLRTQPAHYAGELIERCDLKGFRLGGVAVSEKHANFFINHGEASSRDIESLIDLVKAES